MKFLGFDAASRPASVLVAGRSIGYVAAFAIPVVLARLFDQTEFGIYKQLFLVYGTLYVLAQIGVAESLYYFVPRKPDESGRNVAAAVATLTLAGLGCAGLLALTSDWIAAMVDTPELGSYIPLLATFLALMLIAAPFEIVLVSRKRYVAAAWTYAASDFLRTFLLIAPVVIFGGVRPLLIGAIAFAVIRLVSMAQSLWREFSGDLRLDRSLWRGQFTYALPFAFAVAIEVIQTNFHQYYVASRFDAATFAIYAVGCLQIPLVDVIVTSSANVMMIRMAAQSSDRQGEIALGVWHHTIQRLAFLLFPLTVFLLLAADHVITLLFTSSYAASVPIFRLWTLTILPSVLCVDAVLRAHAQTRFIFAMNVWRLGIVVGLIGWFLGEFGLAGAVLVTLVASVIARLVGITRIARLTRSGIGGVLPWARLATTMACAVAAGMPAYWIISSPALPRLLALVSATVVYGGFYLMLSYASSRWIHTATDAPPRRLFAWLTEG